MEGRISYEAGPILCEAGGLGAGGGAARRSGGISRNGIPVEGNFMKRKLNHHWAAFWLSIKRSWLLCSRLGCSHQNSDHHERATRTSARLWLRIARWQAVRFGAPVYQAAGFIFWAADIDSPNCNWLDKPVLP